ncbi:helix-turn-helix transcriptional regulator [Pseudomonas sp. 10B1]|uniref:AraC family transcriptional regulator n=4 Tax=Pseudomonas TaxID=286 RepID=UPI002AB50EFD|nr:MULTISPECIES: helix-turn-helix transcriptional regulator [unclassified Pseudomonas]MDY7560800.1 helix-turn-helix transcriptional regulator [Pseudomonas sp. AB6]MEA9996883.1 helix-turn-helix transcriptional regulator [Pseudomonas sp. AA4]MEB0128071.1 helix-turn-helix transcriptional regulator [Pseudomonas sp. CCC1.2]MEB0154554.1 helix-turn-helix transcriptional regulator [Pseudomonas sp. CCC4.3]MEB0212722.1 helix-turn-helix transcriptional regulator [Pseudomonas sp. AB6]
MRNASISILDSTLRSVVAIGTDYEYGHRLPIHSHRRSQLLYGSKGVMQVTTALGTWVVPPQRAVWIPQQIPHEVLFLGVTTHSLYIEPEDSPVTGERCQVIEVSQLMRNLLQEAVDLPLEYDEDGRDGAIMKLLLHEIQRANELPLHIPMPMHDRLLASCKTFLMKPDVTLSAQQWADSIFISVRTFNRLFQEQTGLSFGQWRQRACVVLALSRLADGNSVTCIALEMGYESPAAFATMFRRVLGCAPSTYLNS